MIGTLSVAMAQAQKAVVEPEPQPIEPPKMVVDFKSYRVAAEYPIYSPPIQYGAHPQPNYHPKRPRKSNPLSLGSYKQKRK